MIEVKTDCDSEYKIVSGYEVKEKSDVFEYIQKAYSSENEWGKEEVLTDVKMLRCSLNSLTRSLFCATPTLEAMIKGNINNYIMLEDFIEDLPKYDKITIALPQIMEDLGEGQVVYHRGRKPGFAPLKVKINEDDYTYLFEDFSEHEDQMIEEVFKVFNFTDWFTGLERVEIQNMLVNAINEYKQEKEREQEGE